MLYCTGNPHGGDIYAGNIRVDFSANTNPFGTPPGVLEAMRQVLQETAHYPDPYCRKLIKAIAAHEKVPENMILCGCGAAELIYSFCLARKQHSAAELAPTFSEYALGLKLSDCIPDRYILDPADGFMPDDRFLSWLEEKKPEVLFLCTPNNPTGCILPHKFLERVLALCDKLHTTLFLDECFLDLADRAESMKDRLDEHSNLIILKAFTKSYGMAGIRLGYCLCSDPELLRRMSQTVQPWNISIPAQAAGIAALQEKDFLTKTKNMVSQQRGILSEGLSKLGFRVIPGEANYILFQAPCGLKDMLLEEGIAIRSCANYEGLDESWYRIAVKLPEENQLLMDTLARLCRKDLQWH